MPSEFELGCAAVAAQRKLSKNLYCLRKQEETICLRKHLSVFIMSVFYYTSARLVLSVQRNASAFSPIFYLCFGTLFYLLFHYRYCHRTDWSEEDRH